MYIPQQMPFLQTSDDYQRIDISFYAGADMSTPAKKGVGVQNGQYSRLAGRKFYVHSTGNPYVYIFYIKGEGHFASFRGFFSS